jgi:hypothetical protein
VTDRHAPSGDGPNGHGPVFVVGSMRSGSTLLRLILDSHPRIAIGAETGFMGAVMGTKRIPDWKYGAEWYERIGWSETELDERLRDFYAGMFERYAAGRGKARWGEKTPFHTALVAEMAEVFPTAVFVGIVRHPGAVAASLGAGFHYGYDEGLRYWTATNRDLVDGACRVGDRFVLCRYEDLVTDPEPVLREVMETVGEEFSPALLQHHVVQQEQGAPRVVEGSTNTRDAVDPSRARRWAEGLTAEERASLDATAPWAAFFGYPPVQTGGSLASDAPSGRSWTLTGSDLAHLRERWRDRVDFASRPSSPALDADPQEVARRLAHVEAALARVRSRRAVRLADALRGLQHGRSRSDLAAVWAGLRRRRP